MPRYTVDLSNKVIEKLDSYAEKQNISRAEALRRALSLLIIADQEGEKGNTLGIVREEGSETKVVARITGV